MNRHRNPHRRPRTLFAGALGAIAVAAALVWVPAAAADAADAADNPDSYDRAGEAAGYAASYSYVRTLEGSATLIQGDTSDRDALQINQPILVGDRVWVAPNGRVEIALSDRNLLRIDGSSEVVFEALAASPERQDHSTVLRLPQGNVQLVIVAGALGDELPRIDTPNATVYPYGPGSFRVTSDGADWTEVVARGAGAEVSTPENSNALAAGEELVISGTSRARIEVRRAGREDALELWGRRLDDEARYASRGDSYTEDSLRYDSARLDRYGSWVSVGGRRAWRPQVGADWRPYYDGHWRVTPLGMTWVSYEPWGWVPYHYGSWDYVPGYGWSWFPGNRFGPAWVYWYWADGYVGWVPTGYYTRHYSPWFGSGYGFRHGVYGWAGGSWDDYRYWNFCDVRYLGRNQRRHVDHGDRFGERNRYAVPRRGILTTDTRGLDRSDLVGERAGRIPEVLRRNAPGDLPDVTAFVARKPELPRDVRDRVAVLDGRPGRDGGDAPARLIAVDRIARPGGEGAPDRPLRTAPTRTAPTGPIGEMVSRRPTGTPATDSGEARDGARLGGTSPPRLRPDQVPARRESAGVTPPSAAPRPDTPRRSTRDDAAGAAPRRPEAPARSAPSASAPPPAPAPSRSERPPQRTETPSPSRAERAPSRPAPPREPPQDLSDRSWRARQTEAPTPSSASGDRPSLTRRVIEGRRGSSESSSPFRVPPAAAPNQAPSRSARPASPPPPSSNRAARPAPQRAAPPPSAPRPAPRAVPQRSAPRQAPSTRSQPAPSRPPSSARSSSSSSSSGRSSSARSSSSRPQRSRSKPPGTA